MLTLRGHDPCATDLLDLHEAVPERYPFLIESVASHPRSACWDILFSDPEAALTGRDGCVSGPGADRPGDNFFDALDRWVASDTAAATHPGLPFEGGWFFLLGYEAARWVEPQLDLPASPHGLPDALAVRCRSAVLRHRVSGEIHLVSELGTAAIERMRRDLDRAGRNDEQRATESLQAARVSEDPAPRFEAGVSRIIELLRSGDAFQVNLSRAWDAEIGPDATPAALYRQLRGSNPAPFAGLALWQGEAVISSSPERLVQRDAQWVQTRPIAGTRRRGGTPDEDRQLREKLISNIKERAEHVMLIDLERNDLGRICVPGSIAVDELMTLETYAHVHHIVSNVRGRPQRHVGPGAVLKAVFPGGTITGCPKVRVMQIIAELEEVGRGPYTGSMGYISRDGRMDSNILIRSIAWQRGKLRLRAGAGIVVDSLPAAELQETRAKARGLLLGLGAAP